MYRDTSSVDNTYDQNRDIVIKHEKKQELIELVNNYIYLKQQVSTIPSMKEEARHNISLEWQAFGRESSVFKQTYQWC